MLAEPILTDAPAGRAAVPPDTRTSTTPTPAPSLHALPTRDADEMALRRRLQPGLRWCVDDAHSPWCEFELVLLPSRPDSARPLDPEALVLETAHGALLLDDDRLVALATGVHLPRIAERDMADAVGALRHLVCASWPAPLAQALGGAPIRLTSANATQAACGSGATASGTDTRHAALLTLVSHDGDRQAVPIRSSARTWLASVATSGWQLLAPRGPMPAGIASLPAAGGLWAGRVSLPASSLSAIRSGDAFWLPPRGHASSSPLCLFSGSRLLHLGQVDHLTRQFQGWGPEGGAPSNSLHPISPSTEPRNVDALTVDLDFIVGRVAMTVGELSALAAGQIVPLEALTPATVRIVAHGTELGAGQLVEVEGRLAVEVLQWGNAR